MNENFTIQELSIVILARQHNPSILNPDFLKYNDIVPKEWELSAPPLCVEPMAQVQFKNTINITAQLDKIIFFEKIAEKNETEILTPEVAYNYIKTLPHVEYIAVGINPKGHVAINLKTDDGYKFLSEKFITSGPWQDFGDSNLKPNLKFTYTFGNIVCTLAFEVGFLKGQEKKHVIIIDANIHHALTGGDRKNRFAELCEFLKNWKNDVNLYKDIVEKFFIQ